MASNKKGNAFALSKGSFAGSLNSIGYRFSLPKVFDDFLSMSIAACTQNIATGLSYYEDEYLQMISHYKDSPLRFEFQNAFAQLVNEMEDRVGSSGGNDVLGEFYEEHISHGKNGEFFTPYHICEMMTRMTHDHAEKKETPLRILDPACGSGRMLLASNKILGLGHEHYGIDINRTCVKMTALNLFLNGMWNSEVMCINALFPDDFVIAYHISFLPLGIFKIEEKEKSRLWHLHRNSFAAKEKPSDSIVLDKTPFSERPKDNSTQLGLF